MLAGLLIVLREVLEAGLIVSIVVAATNGVAGRAKFIAGGIGAGVIGALILAAFAGALSNALAGLGKEAFTATILTAAVLMLSWHTIWMARHGREIAANMKDVGRAVARGDRSLLALGIVVAIAVLREGSEIVLFLYGIAASTNDGPVPLAIGGALGLVAGIAVSYALYRGIVAIPMRHFFAVTNGLIALLAAGMAGQVAVRLTRLHLVPSLGDRLWDTSWLISDQGLVGSALRALFGYSSKPSGIQLCFYLATLAVLVVASRLIERGQLSRAAGATIGGKVASSPTR